MKIFKSPLNTLLLSVAIIVIAVFIYAIAYSTTKAGFGFSDKTFMDWIELLIIPVTLAIAAYVVNSLEKERENERLTDQRQEEALQHYFDKVIDIIRNNRVLSEEDLTAIRIRTLTVLRMLDGNRKGFVIKFLFENGLIVRKTLIINDGLKSYETIKSPSLDLTGADLRCVNLQGMTFYVRKMTMNTVFRSEIILADTDMKGANLESAEMSGADFSGAKLTHSNLSRLKARDANFLGADFSYSVLRGAYLVQGSFKDAIFKNADCTNVIFSYSSFFDTFHPNGGNPFTSEADFSGAKLENTNFDGAEILPDQLQKARLQNKIRLPDSSLYSGHHPLFSTLTEHNSREKAMWVADGSLQGGVCGCKEDIIVDVQKIVDKKSQELNRFGQPVPFDQEKEVLKALWVQYHSHRLKKFSSNTFTKLLYILVEYEPGTYIAGANFVESKLWDFEQGIRFWKTYKKTKGFTSFNYH